MGAALPPGNLTTPPVWPPVHRARVRQVFEGKFWPRVLDEAFPGGAYVLAQYGSRSLVWRRSYIRDGFRTRAHLEFMWDDGEYTCNFDQPARLGVKLRAGIIRKNAAVIDRLFGVKIAAEIQISKTLEVFDSWPTAADMLAAKISAAKDQQEAAR